jgi:hypothetical protein
MYEYRDSHIGVIQAWYIAALWHSRHRCALTIASQTPLEQVQRHGTFFAPVLIGKSNDADLKKFTAPLATLSKSVFGAIVNLCLMYKNAAARGFTVHSC